MGPVYSAIFSKVTVAAVQDLFSLLAADDKPITLHAVFIGQSSLEQDTNEDLLTVQIVRGNTSQGSGGSTPTARALHPGYGTAGATVHANDTTTASGGTEHILHIDTFNNRTGWQYIPVPEDRPHCQQEIIAIELLDAPASSTWSGTIIWEEG